MKREKELYWKQVTTNLLYMFSSSFGASGVKLNMEKNNIGWLFIAIAVADMIIADCITHRRDELIKADERKKLTRHL